MTRKRSNPSSTKAIETRFIDRMEFGASTVCQVCQTALQGKRA